MSTLPFNQHYPSPLPPSPLCHNIRSCVYIYRKRSCTNCCSRWWIEVDGAECDESVETSISSSRAYNIFAPTTLTGVCAKSGDLVISNGLHSIRLMVGSCPGFGVSNTASGFHSTSRFIVDEIPRREYILIVITMHTYLFDTKNTFKFYKNKCINL